ncbi:alpha-keto acid decarboxylase family protein [Mycolicibacterium sp. P1-18]|uniref:alpha-keto acid decarboxylase family protein n=1 Tax=Mycolicibacterium sp. P1-18 TaxID=2024615 RepID=UPI0011F38DDC|nr:thiamine pyrophosphate-binding protein [Mycolicibacterium sp. P1-18]KAA0097936.1 alpha-keto acid decarboxylase family protein [Mycolicibacterium sp. P1-18]
MTVTTYLLTRLRELGVAHVFGVPGDYSLAVLDEVLDTPGIEWVGTAAELGAAYAADAYARVTGFGALLTTSGVGELSAVNGVAGSFAERVPLLHVAVGPSQAMEDAGAIVHHTAGDGDFSRFAKAHEHVTCAHGVLRADTATAEIDRVLTAALAERRPVYLRMPSDVGSVRVPPPRRPLVRANPVVNTANLDRFTDAVRRRVLTAGSTAVLADFLVDRFGARAELAALVATGLPHAVVSMGKTVLDEGNPLFAGVYAGALSDDATRATVDEADLLIRVGVQLADTTSGGFTQGFPDDAGIDLQPWTARVDGETFDDVPLGVSLRTVTELVRRHHRAVPAHLSPADPPSPAGATEPLTQEFLWDAVSRSLTGEHVVVAEQGTSFFGIASHRFPNGSGFIAQPLWGSIGFGLPAVLGAQLADPSRRCVLLVGDGSAQLTIQELGTIARHDLHPIVLLVNNDGYTVERAIHGPRAAYNDIAAWDWPALPAALGVKDALVTTVRTNQELVDALDAAHRSPDRLVFIEAVTDMDDVPELLRRLAEGVSIRNS